jgi:hypothetical protein
MHLLYMLLYITICYILLFSIKIIIALMHGFGINISYHLICLALMHGLEIKLFLLFEYKLSDAWT